MPETVVTIVIVSWNVRSALAACLRSVLASQGVRINIVVIDNASADQSAAMVAADFPTVKVLHNTVNRGFAAAVNQGLAGATGWVLLLNPDAQVKPDTIQTLLSAAAAFPQVGILGPKLRYPDGRIQASVKRFPRWRDLFFTLSKLPNFFPRLVARYQAVDFQYEKTQIVNQVMGSCFLIRPTTRAQVGDFDEGFWLWYEEVDYSLRAAAAGWQTLYCAEAEAIHLRGQSFRQQSTQQKQQTLRRSIRYYCQKHFGGWAAAALAPGLMISWLSGWLIDFFSLRKPKGAEEF